jgi:hypothetical protein
MFYFCGINNFTELQEKRITLLQSNPGDAARINSEFMQVKDAIIGKRNVSAGYVKKRLPRISYKVEIISDNTTYVELRGDCIYVSPPPYQAFNAEYLNGQFELPKVDTPATMAFFVPPLTPMPIYCFT